MKIYLIGSESDAKRISQLLKLNAECAKLHWSKTIKDLPMDVISSLETLEAFVEKKVYEVCTEKTLAGALSEEEEIAIMTLLRKTPELRATLGLGVVIAGEEANKVFDIVEGENLSKMLVDALASGKNVVVF